MVDRDSSWFEELNRKLSPEELQAFGQQLIMAAETRRMGMGDRTPEHLRNTPRDAAVRMLAGFALKMLRQPDFFQTVVARYGNSLPVSYEEIGKKLGGGVSRERIRQMYAEMFPEEYEAGKESRRTG